MPPQHAGVAACPCSLCLLLPVPCRWFWGVPSSLSPALVRFCPLKQGQRFGQEMCAHGCCGAAGMMAQDRAGCSRCPLVSPPGSQQAVLGVLWRSFGVVCSPGSSAVGSICPLVATGPCLLVICGAGRAARASASALPSARSYEDMLVDEVAPDRYYWAPLAQHERGSLASLDSLRKGGPAPGSWRQPELPEVIAMLSFRLDAVKSNAAAYLQHLCYRNDKVKTEVRKLKGIPVLVGLLDHPKKEVHYGACGALKNISFGKDQDNKIAIKNCDGVPALVRLLRKAHDMDLTEVITGNGEGRGWFGGRGGHQEGF